MFIRFITFTVIPLQLVDFYHFSQIVTSAHYLLSDLYVTDDFLTPDLPVNNESDSEDDRERVRRVKINKLSNCVTIFSNSDILVFAVHGNDILLR